MTATDLSAWLTVADAAQQIGCSTRTIERLTSRHQLEQRIRPQAGSPGVAVYSPESVAEQAQKRHPAPPAFVVAAVQSPTHGNGNGQGPVTSAIATIGQLPADDPIRQLAAVFLTWLQSPPLPPVAGSVAETLFLTIKDAAIYANLPAADIRRACESGELKARKTGRGGWRIRRKDLEAL